MDRNEAIDILRVIAPPRTSKKAFYDFMEARDMAIAALEQAPTFDWLMQKTDEWGMAYGKQFVIEAQRAWREEQK